MCEDAILSAIRSLEIEFPVFVTNVRGTGEQYFFDFPSETERDDAFDNLKGFSISISKENSCSVRLTVSETASVDNLMSELQRWLEGCLR